MLHTINNIIYWSNN